MKNDRRGDETISDKVRYSIIKADDPHLFLFRISVDKHVA